MMHFLFFFPFVRRLNGRELEGITYAEIGILHHHIYKQTEQVKIFPLSRRVYISLPLFSCLSLCLYNFPSSCSWEWREILRCKTLNPCRASSIDCGFWTSNTNPHFSCSTKVLSLFILHLFLGSHRRMHGRELEGMTSSDLALPSLKHIMCFGGFDGPNFGT